MCRGGRTAYWVFGVLAGLLAPSRIAPADGGYYPERAFEKRPGIPVQRAVVRFKDGRETLIVESAVESDSPGLGWVIPLPAVPDKMAKADPGLLESLSTVLGANVVHDLRGHVQAAGFVLLLLLVTLALAASGRGVVGVLSSILVVMLLVALLVPNLAGGRGGGAAVTDGVRVVIQQRVGSYEARVLEADSASALDGWLAANGFASLGEADLPVVESYVEQGWCFFTAKLAREKGGSALPHPISLEFEADRAVYPMRLTGLAGTRLHLELTVVGGQEAVAPPLPRILADTWRGDGRAWLGTNTGARIGHPELDTVFWDGCVVTRFAGELEPDEMTEDIVFSWRHPRPYRKRVFSRKGAFHTGLVVAMWLAAAAMVVVTVVRWRHMGRGTHDMKALRIAGVSLLASLVVGMVVFLALPTREVRTMRHYESHDVRYRLGHALGEGEKSGAFDSRDAGSLREFIRGALESEEAGRWRTNPYTGEPVREETSPGNYEIREEQGKLQVFVYDTWARPQGVWIAARNEGTR